MTHTGSPPSPAAVYPGRPGRGKQYCYVHIVEKKQSLEETKTRANVIQRICHVTRVALSSGGISK